MKTNGFDASPRGGTKVFAVALIVAMLFASFAAVGAFAAPAQRSQSAGGNQSSQVGDNQLRELRFAMAWYTNFRSQPGRMANSSDQARLSQYLDQYAFALRAAQALLVNGSKNASSQGNNANGQSNNTSGQGNNSNGQSSNQGSGNQSAEQQMSMYLHMMRGLRDKIMSVAGSNNNRNGNFAVGNNGIPVTGGSGNQANSGNNSNQGNANNSGNNNNANQGNANNNKSQANANNNNNSQVAGGQMRELSSAIAWFNNFKTQPGKMKNAGDRAQISRYLDRYATILRAATGVLVNGGSNANSQSNSSNGQGGNASSQSNGQFNSQYWNNLTTQQKLSTYLGMLRGLREKIEQGGSTNSFETLNNNNNLP